MNDDQLRDRLAEALSGSPYARLLDDFKGIVDAALQALQDELRKAEAFQKIVDYAIDGNRPRHDLEIGDFVHEVIASL